MEPGRELDLYSSQEEPAESKPAQGAPKVLAAALELDLYEGVDVERVLAEKLLELPRRTDEETLKGPATARGAGKPPGWLVAVWRLFPALLRERYQPMGVIGEGGMGIVLEAHDRHLDRTVAIKGPRDPAGLSAEQRSRQAVEARISARLSHPNILPVYDVWRDANGNPWCSMMRVPGESPTLSRELSGLTECGCVEQRPLSRLLETFLQICRALSYAHRQRILHRDLKPENIFIGPAGEALVADWGVAQDLAAPESESTSLVGTPGYAAPEQLGAFGRPWSDARSDLYSLGVILFEMVVGRRYTDAATVQSDRIVRRRPHEEPAVLPDRVPRELAAIVRKASAVQPAERYPDVDALRSAVETYLMGGVLEGLAYTPVERFRKWARRAPVAAASIALAVALTLGVLINVSYLSRRHRLEAERYSQALRDTNYRFAQLYAEKAATAALQHTPDRALHNATLALQTCPRDQALPNASACSIAARPGDAGRLIWTVPAGSPMLAVAFAPDGRRLASAGSDGTIVVRDVESQALVARLGGHRGWVGGLAFDPAGTTLISAGEDGLVRVWDVASARARFQLSGHPGPILALALDRQGRRAFSAGVDRQLVCWDLVSGKKLWRRPQAITNLHGLDVDPGGERVAAAGGEASIPLMDTATGELRISIADTSRPARQVLFSPEGQLLALGGCPDEDGRQVMLWDLSKWQPQASLPEHGGPVTALAFHPNGGLLATGSDDMTIRLWSMDNHAELLHLEGHTDAVTSLAFSPDGLLLASAGLDGTVRLWDTRVGPAAEGRVPLEMPATDLAFSPSGSQFASLAADGRVRLWDLETFRETARTSGEHRGARGLAFEPGGNELLYETGDGDVIVWNVETRREEKRCRFERSRASALRTADRQVMAVTLRQGEMKLEEPGKPAKVLEQPPGANFTAVALSYCRGWIAAAEEGRDTYLWKADTCTRPIRLTGPVEGLDNLRFSPDGSHLVRAGGSRAFHVWSFDKRSPEAQVLEAHSSRILCFAFSADGRYLATGSKDGETIVWDASAWSVLWRLKAGAAGVAAVAFSADGKWLVAAKHGAELVFWNLHHLEDVEELSSQMAQSSPFGLFGVELVVDGRVVPATPRFPASHPFRWTAAARTGDRLAMLRAGLLMAEAWRPGQDLPRGWGIESKRWLAGAGRPDLAEHPAK